MSLDQEKVTFDYDEKPDNAHWLSVERDEAVYEATFDVELLVPRADVVYRHEAGQYRLSPFMQLTGLFGDNHFKFRADEQLRRNWLSERRAIVERLCTHFERGNWELFAKEVRQLDPEISIATQAERFEAMRRATWQLLPMFMLPHFKYVSRIEQRVALARSKDDQLTKGNFFTELARSGRIHEWWRQIRSVRSSFFEAYPYHHVILQPLYWREKRNVEQDFVVSNKGFQVLKDLYISAFETLARISVIAMGLEAIIHHGTLSLPTKRGSLSVLEFEGLQTANKRVHIERYPISDIFSEFLDTRVRNGIGHNAARYDAVDDVVVLIDSKGMELSSDHIPYTEFCRKVVSMASRLFIAETYLNLAISTLDGHLASPPAN